ncbi:DUF2501 domain-containing protein [Pseudomonas multiresinivorans]|uniref:DUF2501 domain-containing protein n=1 Tax=Pseudomonas multiresinivorans TaxID=95301 RepID=A0A7Z3GQR5_9PSED|nr:DUF2501 domain-containing protein [Pseudomonas multiresinivorans]QJP09480.1 DUF2501 domain-containing protein [Pseudomonas multiresinivorans]
MNARKLIPAVLTAVLTAVLLPWSLVQAASLGDVAGSLGGLGNLSSVSSSSSSNVAGLLEYCAKNNYLNADAATQVKDKLLGKLPGNTTTSDSGYKDGAKGILTGSDGKSLDLSGSGIKEKVTKQVCDKVLSQGKSLL